MLLANSLVPSWHPSFIHSFIHSFEPGAKDALNLRRWSCLTGWEGWRILLVTIDRCTTGQNLDQLAHGAPGHGDQDATLHRLDQRNGLVHRFRPAFDTPRLFPANLALLQVGKLPEMMHGVQVTDLDKPCPNAFHNFAASLEATTPVCLPFKQISGVQSVGTKFEKPAQSSGRSGGPEGELLHQRRFLALDQALQLPVECGKLGVAGNIVKGGMVTLVSLIFPDVDYCHETS